MYKLEHFGGPSSKLCFGVYDYDGIVACLPPIKRAVRETIVALEAAGHSVIKWNPMDHDHAISILQRTFASDHGEEFERLFSGSQEVSHVPTESVAIAEANSHCSLASTMSPRFRRSLSMKHGSSIWNVKHT